ncbi:helix-turn-helix domain-containing protein [Methylorubrum extorquens]
MRGDDGMLREGASCRKEGSVRQLAQRVGVSGATVWRWERGRELITFERRERIADVLGLDPARLLEPGAIVLPVEDRRILESCHSLPPSERAAIRDLLGLRGSAAERASC